jgi:hypothetical protein
MDVPDRLPFEVLDRLYGDDGPPPRRHIEPRKRQLVISSKHSGTFRPLVRLDPLDLITYQALVDDLAPDIEATLGPPTAVGAYRQTLGSQPHAFEPEPTGDEFRSLVRREVGLRSDSYVLAADISSYFLAIRIGALRDILLDTSADTDVIYDLADLLAAWQRLGIRGLPQGARPSMPLGNLYLASLDRAMGSLEVPFFRWVDDMWAICPSYSDARRVQDEIERHLYGVGLTLNGEKTRILRAQTALDRLEPAARRHERRVELAVEEIVELLENAEYVDPEDIPDDEDIDLDVTSKQHDQLSQQLESDDLASDFQTEMGLVYRRLERLASPYGLASIPRVLIRAPDLTGVAMRYASSLAASQPAEVGLVFAEVLSADRMMRDSEKLMIAHRALLLKPDASGSIGERLGELAMADNHPLVRARALIAWGMHSQKDDFSAFDRFLADCEPEFRVYAIVSIQDKASNLRDQRYDEWARSGTLLGNVAAQLRGERLSWKRL